MEDSAGGLICDAAGLKMVCLCVWGGKMLYAISLGQKVLIKKVIELDFVHIQSKLSEFFRVFSIGI